MVNLSVVKQADRTYILSGLSNKIRYSIVITNTGDTTATNVKLKDYLGEGACFVPGTMTINGCKQDVIGLNYTINIGAIPPNESVLLTFDAQILPQAKISQLTNQAVVTYCDETGNMKEVLSNLLVVPVINLNVCIQKTVDKTQALIGEVISYSIMISNRSNIAINNATFIDEVSAGLEILPASVMINGIPQYIGDLSHGMSLGTLAPNSSQIVSFQGEVISYPTGGIITNCAMVEYDYTVMQLNIPTTSIGEACSNQVYTTIVNKTVSC